MKKLKERIKAAWAMLTQPHAWYACWSKSIDDEPVTEAMLCREALIVAASQLEETGELSTERWQMIMEVIDARSVILQSIREASTALDITVPFVIYDCESEEDFKELREQEVE